MKYKIENSEQHSIKPANNPIKYPFEIMEIGDSFLAEGIPASVVSPSCAGFGKKLNRRFSVRKVDNESARVWRVS